MPYYHSLRRIDDEAARERCAERLLALRAHLACIPPRTIEDTVLLATWNVRELDGTKYGGRLPESFFYIAEIISRFDLVAIQEVREDLGALERVRSILGEWWKYVVTDVTEGSAGNGERMAFLYDSRKVVFAGIAGEIVLPDRRGRPGEPIERALQFARTPFLCGFRAGWARFDLCTVHIYYGQSKAEDPRRVHEIRELARLLAARAKKRERRGGSRHGDAENLVLLGDFNIFNRGDATMAALEQSGFVVPDAIRGGPGSNLDQRRHYDQIAFHPRARRLAATGRAGVLDYFDVVYRDEDEPLYAEAMGPRYAAKDSARKRSAYYKQWRTFQMSDHLVLWTELDVGHADEYLTGLSAAAR